ncbi:YifB family Mg chelatase-like AAA ATPase [Aminipila butyrica]|uniref:YifB family Mg chelatase-like AAA ATPase n=1 Tax=Aminipila butyrica TaxID=433296 RepID=A0A858BV95_9FIRM|nr:YifB family Mg chelatase-like AAA ATPase [Aminipila butyrica]QIB69971.1 YifB family Mg chelatase-like AAA ATPase [Aminipila butyrica]
MLSTVYTAVLHGLEAELVTVETDLSPGLPTLTMVGLPDITVREAKERIRSAIINSGYAFPSKRITVNLSPANTRKEGSHFDLPIAVGILISTGILETGHLKEYAFLGELSLTGSINRVDGALPLVLGLKERGIERVILPEDNLAEASLVQGIRLYPAADLSQLVAHFGGGMLIRENQKRELAAGIKGIYELDYADVLGQERVKRAVTICCAGGHGMLLMGPPGSGKSMIAKRMATVLPEMTYEECLDVTKIYSVGGHLSRELPLIQQRPFRAPHHTVSGAALIGGGSRPSPGEISLAHRGVLFLDELPEFSKRVLEMLRQPLEDNQVTIARVNGNFTFPSQVMLVAASNPCPCGYFGSPLHQCTCSSAQIHRYMDKLSGPLLDRIDLHVKVLPVDCQALSRSESGPPVVSSADMRSQVEAARRRQRERYETEADSQSRRNQGDSAVLLNGQLSPTLIRRHCQLDQDGKQLMETAFKAYGLSARAYSRILKIARTIADLQGSSQIQTAHVAEALSYRTMDRHGAGGSL